jgi:hypothetical protein
MAAAGADALGQWCQPVADDRAALDSAPGQHAQVVSLVVARMTAGHHRSVPSAENGEGVVDRGDHDQLGAGGRGLVEHPAGQTGCPPRFDRRADQADPAQTEHPTLGREHRDDHAAAEVLVTRGAVDAEAHQLVAQLGTVAAVRLG